MKHDMKNAENINKKTVESFGNERYKYMISWRNKKICLLEEEIRGYEEALNICYALIAAMSCGKKETKRISKSRVSKALEKNYSVTCDDKYYYINCGED